MAVILLLPALAACGTAGGPAATQKLPIESGSFGLVDKAEVVSIDFVRFDAAAARYNRSAAWLAREWLNRSQQELSYFLEEFVGEFSDALVSDIEEEIRNRACIYVVRPSRTTIPQLVAESLDFDASSVAEDIYDLLTPEEEDYLDSLEDLDDYDAEYERLLDKYTPESGLDTGDITEVAVASQCLINVHVGDPVTVVKFEDYVSISPVLDDGSYARTQAPQGTVPVPSDG